MYTTYGKGLAGYQANRWQTAQFMNFEVRRSTMIPQLR